MYILHIANKNYSSWSLRPWIVMKQLNIPFEEKLYPFGDSNFRDFSPSGKVPCLFDADIMIWDSLAIVEYLAEKNSDVWPQDVIARAWARSVAAEMHSGFSVLRHICGMNVGVRATLAEIEPGLKSDIDRIEEIWNVGRREFGGPFLAGKKFSAADAFFAPVVFRFQTYDLPLTESSRSYCNLILSLDSMKLWQEQALNEIWRDENHEKELAQFCTVIEDKRNG